MKGNIEETLRGVDKPILSLREIAKLLDKHISTVVRWTLGGVRGHRLPRTFIGGHRHIRRDDLIEFLRLINGQADTGTKNPSVNEVQRRRLINEQLAARGF